MASSTNVHSPRSECIFCAFHRTENAELLWCQLCRQQRHWRISLWYDDVIKWKHFPRNWPFARGIHRSPVNSPHKGQWRGALMFSFICARISGWVNNGKAVDLRRHRVHYDVTVMKISGAVRDDKVGVMAAVGFQCIAIALLHTFHNAPVPYPTMHHFVTEMCTCVHIFVTK